MQISFKLANTEDAATLVAFEQRVADPKLYGPPRDLQRALTEITHNTFFFIKKGDTLLGTVAYCRRPLQTVYVSNLAVDPLYRELGVARAAMLFIVEKCTGNTRIELAVHPDNQIALRLYTSLGFKIQSRHENYFDDGEPRLLLVSITDRCAS
jgi:ribosomal protein S18 acetylase RimI-like enzyme